MQQHESELARLWIILLCFIYCFFPVYVKHCDRLFALNGFHILKNTFIAPASLTLTVKMAPQPNPTVPLCDAVPPTML